jgi:hypothetical protein
LSGMRTVISVRGVLLMDIITLFLDKCFGLRAWVLPLTIPEKRLSKRDGNAIVMVPARPLRVRLTRQTGMLCCAKYVRCQCRRERFDYARRALAPLPRKALGLRSAKHPPRNERKALNDYSGNGNCCSSSQCSAPFWRVHSNRLIVKVVSLAAPKVGSFMRVEPSSAKSTIFICGSQFWDL